MDPAAPGNIIDDKYTVLSVLGTGGMGSVVKAKQAGLNRIVAIKLVHRTFLHDDESLARFEREGQALSTVTHKNIGAFYSYGFWQPPAQATEIPYIVMEYLEGKSLHAVIHESGALGWKRTVNIGIQIANAMEHMHAAGLLHRDLKPNNVLLLNQPEADFVKVVDFGLAKFVADLASTGEQKLTHTGELVGTIHYMSPEICSGNRPDERSDIYSLGVLLYECLTATVPHQADSPIGIIYKCVNEEIEAPSKRAKEKLPVALEAVLMKALAKDPTNRFQSMSELKNDLHLIDSDQGTKCLAVANPAANYKKAYKFDQRFLQVSIFCAIVLAVGCFCFTHSKRIQAPTPNPTTSNTSIVKESLAYLTKGKDAKFFEELDAAAREVRDDKVQQYIDSSKILGPRFLPRDFGAVAEASIIQKKGKPLDYTQIYGPTATRLWVQSKFDQAERYAILELMHHQAQVKPSNLACAKALEILGHIESARGNFSKGIYFLRQSNRLVLAQSEILARDEYEVILINELHIATSLYNQGSIKEATDELAAFLVNPKIRVRFNLTKAYVEAAKYYDILGKRKEAIKYFHDAIADSYKFAGGPDWEQRCSIFKEAFHRASAHGERAELKNLLELAAREKNTGISDSAAAESPELLCLEYGAELQLLEGKQEDSIETLKEAVEYAGKLQFDEVEHWRRNADRLRIILRHENRQKEIRSFELQMLNNIRKAPKSALFKRLLWFNEYALAQRDCDDLLEKIAPELENLARKEKDKKKVQTWLVDSALQLRMKKQFNKARPLLESAYKLDTQNFQKTYPLGFGNRSNRSIVEFLIEDYLRAGQSKSAIAMIDKAAGDAGDAKSDSAFVIPILLQKSEVLRHSGKFDEALDVLKQVQQTYESEKEALKQLSGRFLVLHTLKENWSLADKFYTEMKNNTGSDPWAIIFYLKRKHLYKELEQFMQATQKRQYEDALRKIPATDTSSRCVHRACISSDADHFAEGMVYFNKGIELARREEAPQQRTARIESSMGDSSVVSRKSKQACLHWKNSLNLCQEPYDEILIAKQHLGWYYLHIGKLEQAMKLLKQGYDDLHKPAYLNSGYELFYGSCFAQKGQLKEALNVFQDHNTISFDDIATWSGEQYLKNLVIARAYYDHGEFQKAENLLSSCVRFAKTEYTPCDLLWHEVFSLYRDTLKKCGKQVESQAAEAELKEPLIRNYRCEWYYERPQ